MNDKNFSHMENEYLTPPETEQKVWGVCSICGEDIYYGDDYFEICDINICPECMDYARKEAGHDW